MIDHLIGSCVRVVLVDMPALRRFAVCVAGNFWARLTRGALLLCLDQLFEVVQSNASQLSELAVLPASGACAVNFLNMRTGWFALCCFIPLVTA